jgi:hypothetical protein
MFADPVLHQTALALAGDDLDDDLAAVDLGILDQFDPAEIAAIGDAHLGRPDAGVGLAIIDHQPERVVVDADLGSPQCVADPPRIFLQPWRTDLAISGDRPIAAELPK